jgi:hypothetical protein
MPHVWHLFASVMPEARRAIAHIGSFVTEQMTVTTASRRSRGRR